MYQAIPIGLNTKDSDSNVKDGSLQESINMQWRDNALRPIPERIISDIDASLYTRIIFHKVSDENQINVLGFNTSGGTGGGYLAQDLAGYLGESFLAEGVLTWFGTIIDGVYTAITPALIPIEKTDGMSFTILNGLIYFIGDGSNEDERYYYKLQYNETWGNYEVKDMYAWKALIPFFPEQGAVELTAPNNTYQVFSQCGLILIRFALVLDSGSIVLHSPIYGYTMNGLNRSATAPQVGDLIENIHSFVNLNLEFADSALFDSEVSAINVYATTPYYVTKFPTEVTNNYSAYYAATDKILNAQFQIKAEEPFYLIKTIDAPSADKLLLTVGDFAGDITYTGEYARIEVDSIAAAEVMPVDNFTYHELYGKITSNNGRLVIERPKTVLSPGHIRALSLEDVASQATFKIDTEDGVLSGINYLIDKSLRRITTGLGPVYECRGMLSYPDIRANSVGANVIVGLYILLYRTRKNTLHNLACAFNIYDLNTPFLSIVQDITLLKTSSNYCILPKYFDYDEVITSLQTGSQDYYSSENRVQFSEAGEFRVFPAINSYRIGEGLIRNVGINSVNPTNADIVAPLIVGTSDGIYTINLAQNSVNLVSSVTKTVNIPYISEETLQIEDTIVFISDQGLMGFQNGGAENLTSDFFPDQGDGGFPVAESVYPNYNLLTADFFGGAGNIYLIGDVVEYLKNAILAYDSRRKNIWCCNPTENFSLVFNIKFNTWGFSTTTFSEKAELFSTLTTVEGDIYSRFMLKNDSEDNLLILSGEDLSTEVEIHLLTRPIKMGAPKAYKKLKGLFSRCELFRNNTGTGYFSFGVWGKQDHNKLKMSIPIAAKKDDSAGVYPGDVRQDIPLGWQKGKYKSVVILQSGLALPDSSIHSFEFDEILVDTLKTR